MNQRAVNTVVGTVILVGVVVILAAAVGVFVLGIGGTMFESPPSAMVSYSWFGRVITPRRW